jgi:ribosomal-protein-alanine N-acetyltransferase
MQVFETERMVVRHFTHDDLDAIDAITGDPEVNRYAGDGQPLPRSEAARWIDVSLNNYATKGYGASAIIEKATGAFIGICGLVRSSLDIGDAEVIYFFTPSSWGKGLAKELLPALFRYGFETHGLGQVIATIHPDNVRSQRVAEASGMRYLFTDPPHHDGDTPALVYGIDNPNKA